MAKAIGWCLSSSILWLASNGKVFFADLSIRINDEFKTTFEGNIF